MKKRRTYSDKLKDPRWQRLRLRVLERDEWRCQECGDTKDTLHVHHTYYKGEPWDAPIEALRTLCAPCHDDEYHQRPEIQKHIDWATKQMGLMDAIGLSGALCKMIQENPEIASGLVDAIGFLVDHPDEIPPLAKRFLDG